MNNITRIKLLRYEWHVCTAGTAKVSTLSLFLDKTKYNVQLPHELQ